MADDLRAPMSVLIVEDDDDSAQSCAELLALKGHAVRIATAASEALQLVAAIRPDVILLDIGLPGMDGWQLADRIRALANPPVLIAVTGYGQAEDLRRSKEAGIHLHLIKPVQPTALLELLSGVARRVRPPRANECA